MAADAGEIIAPGEMSLAEIEDDLERRWHHHAAFAVDHYLESCMVLVEAKRRLGHGRWLPWLKRINLNDRTAARRMKVVQDPNIVRVVQGKSVIVSNLPTSQSALLALCGHDQETFDALAESGVVRPDASASDIKAALSPEVPDENPVTLEEIAAAGPYGAIMASPPWPCEGGWTLDEINGLPVADMASKDAALFLWAANEQLPEALDTVAAWGFDYRTHAFIAYDPDLPGKGEWTRSGSRHCLLGVRGRPRRQDKGVGEAIRFCHAEGEQYDVEAARRIMRLVPGPYLHLFAQDELRGWTAWGT